MKKYLLGFFYSMPIQMVLMHFRRYQLLLLFWYVLFATITGNFMHQFGANSLYLAPEYLGKVSAVSMGIVGVSVGVFIMSWNITTFILHGRHIKFLATTAQPFLKYCINNGVLPLIFLVDYFFTAFRYDLHQELIPAGRIVLLTGGFLAGFILSVTVAVFYFFGADKTIFRQMGTSISSANKKYEASVRRKKLPAERGDLRVDWFLSAKFGLRKPRDVRHYSQEFLDSIFKRHHFAAVLAILVAFIFLILVGYFSDSPIFQIPAAASITLFFAILIAVSGAFYVFFHSWSIPAVLGLYLIFNWMFQHNLIDPRNKAYGLNYANQDERPLYSEKSIEELGSGPGPDADKAAFLQTLEKWKARQPGNLPVMVLIDVSGGGTRSAAFTMHVLQRLDSITNGRLMPQSVLISGASGGMIGAAYFRALYWEKIKGRAIDPDDKKYTRDISKDLLNPLFSSFISRDLIGPAQKFYEGGYAYVKDRAYTFEQKLNTNTRGLLNKKMGDYTAAEAAATIPTIFFNATISRDGRKMIIGSRPARFLMKNQFDTSRISPNDADAIDFDSYFSKQNPLNLSVLTALRINATFPYVLPNVWLPTNPVIDVMDAGLRDNFGQESTLRFLEVFKDWIRANTSKVILIQIRDRELGDWDKPFETSDALGLLTKPLLLLQSNWFRFQDYYQSDALKYMDDAFGENFYRLSFQYTPVTTSESASLSFHLTAVEKKDIASALDRANNQAAFAKAAQLIR